MAVESKSYHRQPCNLHVFLFSAKKVIQKQLMHSRIWLIIQYFTCSFSFCYSNSFNFCLLGPQFGKTIYLFLHHGSLAEVLTPIICIIWLFFWLLGHWKFLTAFSLLHISPSCLPAIEPSKNIWTKLRLGFPQLVY